MEFPEECLWLIGRVSQKLLARNMTMCTAESCTGGLAAALCTGVPGGSRWFCGSIVAYADSVKTRLLGVGKELLTAHGAVSEPVVKAMALGALAATGAAAALAVTGIAGPGGGSAEKPVGTVWFATAVYPSRHLAVHPQGPAIAAFCRTFSGYRDEIRLAAVPAGLEALDVALAGLQAAPAPTGQDTASTAGRSTDSPRG
ncbi:MAG: nicotinamide-nucleotide amidohydrolase family protein [Desulfovibrio sp.]|jgi:nicotinamide-nucleotide amidase|nr:nicotinamide-nucleotide amidohydrolase family protein [Desulfovibrio sp.]